MRTLTLVLVMAFPLILPTVLVWGQPGGGVAALQTQPFSFKEDFSSGQDPVTFWTSYGKKYSVNFKGVTEERARSGKRSFKLDVTLDEASRFIWEIPLAEAVPLHGDMVFSGHFLLGDETTAKTTLGVSFGFPPTHHTGCTNPYVFQTSTDGDWQEVGGEISARGRAIAGSVLSHYQVGVSGQDVGVVLEKIIVDIRGEAGQRAVVYVDDLALNGTILTPAAHRADVARRWTPAATRLVRQIAEWERHLGESKIGLQALTGLGPRAEQARAGLLAEIAELTGKLVTVRQRGYVNVAEKPDIEGLMGTLDNATDGIQALSQCEAKALPFFTTIVRPVSEARILPQDRFVPGRIGTDLQVTLAPGETEPSSFVVTAVRDIRDLGVVVKDLWRGPDQIPFQNVDVKVVKCWYQSATAWVGIRQDKSKRVLIPELLLKDDGLVTVDHATEDNYLKLRFPEKETTICVSDGTDVRESRPWPVSKYPVRDSSELEAVDIPADTNKQFWVTVRAPEDAVPGRYEGRIMLTSGDVVIKELSLEVNVLPICLLPPYYTSSMDYHGRLVPDEKATIGSCHKSREQFRAELANMVAHGLRNCQHYSIRKEILGEVLDIRRDVGMDNRTLYLKGTIPIGNPTGPETLAKIRRDVRDIIEFVKSYGTETVYFYGMDERRGKELASQRAAWTAVREAGGKIFVAGYEENVGMMGDIQDMHVRAGPPSAEEVSKWHALEHRIFCYANPQTGVENPVVYRRNFGLLLWKYDYDGAATNAYQHTFGATWNDFDHITYRSHTIAYPTADGVIDTIAWEGYREGVDDVRYITTLQKLVEAPAKDRKAVTEAKAFLWELKSGNAIETEALDTVRSRIIEHILALR